MDNNIMKIAESLEESDLLIKSISETTKNEAKGLKGWFLGILIGSLGVSLLRNMLTGKWTIRAVEGVKKTDKKKNKSLWRQDRPEFLMPPHLWINFEIKKYYQNKPRLNLE